MELLAFLHELFEHRQALEDHIIANAGGKAEIFGAAEIIAGHDQQVLLLCLVRELLSGTVGCMARST